MAGVDMIGQVQINGVAPRPFDLVGPDHPARVRTLCGDVEKIAAVMLAKFGRPDRADILVQRGSDRTPVPQRSEVHTSELQSPMRTSYAVLCLKKKNEKIINLTSTYSLTNIQYLMNSL